MHAIEGVVRGWANSLRNGYFITIFACCRQTYDREKMKGFYEAAEVGKEDKQLNKEANEEIKAEESDLQDGETRGMGMGSMAQGQIKGQTNYMFLWGCRPQAGVAAKTKMVNDIIAVLLKKRSRDTLTIELPKALDHLKGKDANFEMVTSNTI